MRPILGVLSAHIALWILVTLAPAKHQGFRFSARTREAIRRKKAATLKENQETERRRRSPLADLYDEDDPFAEDSPEQSSDEKSDEEREAEEYEKWTESQYRAIERVDRGKLYRIITEQFGGIRPSKRLREEYQATPNTYKRKDGYGGDEIAEYLRDYYAEFGIENEDDLVQYFAA